MRTHFIKLILLAAVVAYLFSSCVPARKYQDLEAKRNKCLEENATFKNENEKLTSLTNEQEAAIAIMNKQIALLQNDTFSVGIAFRNMSKNYDQLNSTYELLLQKNKELLAGNRSETQKILLELQRTQEGLLKREDELNKLEKEFAAKKKNLEELSIQLASSQQAIVDKERKIKEMQSLLNRKDSIVNVLKIKVDEALRGFEKKGLKIEQRGFNVYVSMEEKLLFPSGSFQVTAEGTDALKKLAKVLEINQDIDIIIEGHTDVVPYKGTGNLDDNWDLSVKRATSILKIISASAKIDPKRFMAAGRGQYHPVDVANTSEARAKNRRSEIILSPKLDEILKIIQSN